MNEISDELTQRIINVRRAIERPGSTDLPRNLAVSDLHGNAWRLHEILRTARAENISNLFLVGDTYSGKHGWSTYRTLRPLVDPATSVDVPFSVVPLWGNHELALVSGMLGNDSQLRFFFGFGGRELIRELNDELAQDGLPIVSAVENDSPTAADLEEIRDCAQLKDMVRWIQQTHRMIAVDDYGTGYLHASPRITRGGHLELQYQTASGLEALKLMERDLAQVEQSDHPVFSALLQTDISPLWGLYEISSAKQFDAAYRRIGIRQLVFGHRHRSQAENISNVNRQIAIAVDFNEGLGGYLLVGSDGLRFRKFTDRASQRTEESTLTIPTAKASAAETHLLDVEEFLVSRFIHAKELLFVELSPASTRYRREFENLETLRRQGCGWVHRLYAELYPLIKDLAVRKEMFSVVVESCDEEAFKSLIHLLYHRTRDLQSYGSDWYDDDYLEAKSFVQVLLEALRQMPVRRLGLLDASLRGTTSRVNLLELYQKIMGLQDPELAIMAIDNLRALDFWSADQEIRRAFFHDVRKVRVRAAQALAARGGATYPLVRTLMQSADNWVRFLAVWTCAKLGENDPGLGQQAIRDLRETLGGEQDWLIFTTGKEMLRRLGDHEFEDFPDRAEIPNLTAKIVDALQQIVDSQREPFRKAFKIYFISVVISSLVYRRGLAGLDLDELKIYVNNADYFPPHFRFYKSATRDEQGIWQGWRRLWIRGETFNRPDGPQIVELAPADAAETPTCTDQTIWLYDHRRGDVEVSLPNLEQVIERFGPGKSKDRVRDALLRHWQSLDRLQQSLIVRLHAAATVKMLFDLPAEVFLSRRELQALETLTDSTQNPLPPLPIPLLALDPAATDLLDSDTDGVCTIVSANWLDAIRYPVRVTLLNA